MVRHGPIEFEYNKITQYIYIGTNLCCKGHLEKDLIKQNIKVDISLEEEHIDEPYGADLFLWIPTKNHYAPSRKQILTGVRMLHECVRNKMKCYVHCQRGHGRAPTLVAAYLVSKGMGVEDAVALIKKKRPVTHPNKRQRGAIKKLQKELRKIK